MILRTGISNKKVTTIYNGVDTDRFSPRPHGQLKEKYGISKQGLLIASIGYLRPPKGYELLMQVASALVEESKEICFLIAGDGEGEYKDFLFDECKRLGLESHVNFIGAVNNPEYILNGCDVFLLPSVTEGFSISTIEAMSCGLPVIVTRSGGPEEIVTNKKEGLLVHKVESEIIDAISYLSLEEVRRVIGMEGRARVVRRFSVGHTIEEYEALYEFLFVKS